MKNYCFDSNESKLFILNYTIKKSDIIVKYASGDTVTIPYTVENENKLRQLMRKQVENTSVKKINKKFISPNISTVISAILVIVSFLINVPTVATYALVGLSSCGLLGSAIRARKIKKIKNDYLKSCEFLENKNQINENIDIKSITNNVSKKTVKQIKKAKVEANTYNKVETLDLNQIDKMSIKDLRKILLNLRRIQEFNFDCSNASGKFEDIEEESFQKQLELPLVQNNVK